jgi:glycosyltransferase involved in cell wall biosynthesis
MQFKDNMSYLNFLIKIFYPIKIVNRIVSNSKGVGDVLRDYYGIEAQKLKIINNGIDIENINNMKKNKISEYKELFYNKDLIKFIIVGRLRVEKGHDYLIKAFSIVKKQLPNSRLIIIGDGPLRNELEQLIEKLALKDDVLLMGLRKNPYKYMANSDIFVFSSKYEGFPNVLLEALACGLPIISTDCETGPREILDNSKYGLLAKVMDINDLAEKMINLANNTPLLEELSKLSIKRAGHFDIKKSLKKWINLIENEIKLTSNPNYSKN